MAKGKEYVIYICPKAPYNIPHSGGGGGIFLRNILECSVHNCVIKTFLYIDRLLLLSFCIGMVTVVLGSQYCNLPWLSCFPVGPRRKRWESKHPTLPKFTSTM